MVLDKTASTKPSSPPKKQGGDIDPYASPKSVLDAITRAEAHGDKELYRDGEMLVMGIDATLPNRCVKCNAPASCRVRRKIYWHHPLYYLTLLVAILLYAIVVLIVRRKIVVRIPLCSSHRRKRLILRLTGLVFAFGALLSFILPFGFAQELPSFGPILAIVLIIFSIILLALTSQILSPARIDGEHAWLHNVSPDFLASLPPAPNHLSRSRTKKNR